MNNPLTYQKEETDPARRKAFIKNIFDPIAPTYDLLNRLLSLGIDTWWRKQVVQLLGSVSGKSALDLCCGTGDLSKILFRKGARVLSLDFSFPMLSRGLKQGKLPGQAIIGDASQLPVRESTIDIATIAFGIRNIPDLDNLITGVLQVLRPGGKFAILELTRPKNLVIRGIYKIYLSLILPVIGGIISGKWKAYRYLSRTISTFINPDELIALLKKHGFTEVHKHSRTFGIATILICIK